MNLYRVLRWMAFVMAAAAGVALLSACNPPPPTKKIIVTTTVDDADANVGDGVCEATAGVGDCTLRAAIQEANASTIRADVTVPPLVFTLTLGAVDDTGASGDLDIAPSSGQVWIHAPLPGARITVGYQPSDAHGLDLRSGTIGISGIGIDASTGGVGVAGGVTTNLAAVSAGRLDVVAGGTVHLLNDTIDTVTSYGALDITFTTIGSLQTWETSTSTISASILSQGCTGPVTSLGYNLKANGGGCGLPGPGDVSALDAGLGSSSGHLASRPPQQGSPAFDAIPAGVGPCAGSPPNDEHGHARPAHGACDMGAVESQAPLNLTVNTTADAHDASVGDRICATSVGSCSLRAAVDEVNRLADTWAGSTVTLAAEATLSLAGSGEDENATGDLDVTSGLVLNGGGHRISAAGIDRVIDIGRATVAMDHVTLAGGRADVGGGLRTVPGARVTLSYSTVAGNQAALRGGGASVGPSSSLTVDHSAILSNSAGVLGGGIYSEAGTVVTWGNIATADGGTANVSQSTFGANTAPAASAVGAGDLGGSAVLIETTVVGQGTGTALQGFDNTSPCSGGPHPVCPPGGTVSGRANIVVSSAPACGVYAAAGPSSVNADASCGVPTRTALLGPLADNGGPTLTYLPYSVSPGVDALQPGIFGLCDATTPTDQRGLARPQGTWCDAGAVEGSAVAPTKSFTVTSPADKVDLVPGDGICDVGGGCTLRAAIQEANLAPTTANTIVIKAGVNPKITRAGTTEDLGGKGDFDIKGSLVIEGNGAVVDAGQLDRVFDHFGGTLTLRNLTVVGGKLTGASLHGAGIRNSGNLVLDGVTVKGNSLSGDTSRGAGVASYSGFVVLTRCTISGNTVSGTEVAGAGVMVALGTLDVRGSTLLGNLSGSFTSSGGAVALFGAQGTITDSTISDNTAYGGSAFDVRTDPAQVVAPSLEVLRSTITGNQGSFTIGAAHVSGSVIGGSGSLCAFAGTSTGYNVWSGDVGSCGTLPASDATVPDLLLGPLAANGGPTQTRLPQLGSPVLDRIPIGTPGLCDATVTTDQRGSVRPRGSACDAGSVER